MLVLSRKTGEGIVIGDDIVLKVVEVKGGNIRIGIDAPRDKKVYRQEVFDRIIEENKQASHWSIDDLDAISSKISIKTK